MKNEFFKKFLFPVILLILFSSCKDTFKSTAQGKSLKVDSTLAVSDDRSYVAKISAFSNSKERIDTTSGYYQIEIYRTTDQWKYKANFDTTYYTNPATGETNELITIEENDGNEKIPINEFTLLKDLQIRPPQDEPLCDFKTDMQACIRYWSNDDALNVTFFNFTLTVWPEGRFKE